MAGSLSVHQTPKLPTGDLYACHTSSSLTRQFAMLQTLSQVGRRFASALVVGGREDHIQRFQMMRSRNHTPNPGASRRWYREVRYAVNIAARRWLGSWSRQHYHLAKYV